MDRYSDPLAELLQLEDRSGPVDVGGHQEWLEAVRAQRQAQRDRYAPTRDEARSFHPESPWGSEDIDYQQYYRADYGGMSDKQKNLRNAARTKYQSN